MKKVFFLIGPPGVGKSTYCRTTFPTDKFDIVSTDGIFERRGKELGMTYNEAFKHFKFKDVENEFVGDIDVSILHGRDVVIDRTNMSRHSRAWLLEKFDETYQKIAIVFEFDNMDILNERLKKRFELEGKSIPKEVMKNMINSYKEPTLSEFDKIFYIPIE